MTTLTRRAAVKFLGLAALALLGGAKTTIKKEPDLTKYCLGKSPARPRQKYTLSLKDYLKSNKIPPVPANFGHENLISKWQMLGNGPDPSNPSYVAQGVGDCAICGPYHAEMLWCAEGDKPFDIDTPTVLDAYTAIAGWDPKNPVATDNGSDVQAVAEYWRTHGLKDSTGGIHKIDCYLALEPGNTTQLLQALYLFDGVGIGIEFCNEWMTAFNAGQAWDAIDSPNIEGGHYVLGVGSRRGMINVVSWGRTQLMTLDGYQQFNDETYIYLNEEKMINGKDLEGFDAEQLMADMADLASEASAPQAPSEPYYDPDLPDYYEGVYEDEHQPELMD